jgi:hypothetical protein
MSTQQPKALRLAEWMERNDASMEVQKEAAAELRRLRFVNAELLESLQEVVAWMDAPDEWAFSDTQLAAARAVIAKATGDKA